MNHKSIPNQYENLSWTEIKNIAAMKRSTIIWPFGAIEQHGPHLPLATDTIFVEEIVRKVLEMMPTDMPLLKIPTQCIGFSPEHLDFAGTLSLSSKVITSIILEVGKQLSDIGFKRLIILNAHGGQISLLNTSARELRNIAPSMNVFPCFIWSGIEGLSNLLTKSEIENGLHASLAETSLMLSLKPDLVGSERPCEGLSQKIPEGWSLEGASPTAWMTSDLSKSGVIGDSRGANVNLGDNLRDLLVKHWYRMFLNLMSSDWPNN